MYFVGAYITSEYFATAISLMRFLLEPDGVRRAHITIRGPYSKIGPRLRKYEGIDLPPCTLSGVGRFMSQTQRTVFIAADVDGLHNIAWKPDYPESMPHITVYDGDSAFISNAAIQSLSGLKRGLSVNLSPTILLEKKEKPGGELPFKFTKIMNMYLDITGHNLRIMNYRDLHIKYRLEDFEIVAKSVVNRINSIGVE